MRSAAQTPEIRIDSLLSEVDERSLAYDVLDGLTRPFKEIPPKHFYDARGSELFEQICRLPEYYPTRAERQILLARADEIVRVTGAGELVELGSGSAEKARILLEAMSSAGTLRRYVPVDVSEERARGGRDRARGRVRGAVGARRDRRLRAPSGPGAARGRRHAAGAPRIVALLGGTIGNFPPGSRRRLLREIGRLLGPRDRLLLGTDLVKDPAVLEAAYDDSQGITAEFNRNVLRVINRELDADFSPEAFEHIAFYDRAHEWIEMRLRARSPVHRAGGRSRSAGRVRRRRGAAHRDQREVHPRRASRPTSRPPGWPWSVGIRTTTDFLPCRWPAGYRVPDAMEIGGSGALVAGGASGLGEATARRLHARRRARRDRRPERGARPGTRRRVG